MSNLNELLSDLNARVQAGLVYGGVKFYGQAILQVKNDKTFPLLIGPNEKGKKISLDSQYPLQSYHRVLGSVTETDYTRGKGAKPYTMRVYTIRNVWLGNLAKLPRKAYDTTDDVKTDVYKVFPTILTTKEIVKTNEESIDINAILGEEFDGNQTKELNTNMIAFYIEYEIRQKVSC